MANRRSTNGGIERIYVWQLPVRLTHWLIFFSIIVLSATGYYIGHPFIGVSGPARDHFVMGTARAVHFYAAIVFTLSAAARIYWMFAGNAYARLTQFVPLAGERLRNLWQTALFYAFIRRHPEAYPGHNAFAGAFYAMVFVVYVVMVATGLALYTVVAAAGSPFRAFDFLVPLFYGLQMARLIHHIGMWFLLIFAVAHIYFVLLSSLTERIGTVDSMFSGYKFLPKRRAGVR